MSKSISVLGCGWLGYPLISRLIALPHSKIKAATRSQQKCQQITALDIDAYQLDISDLQQSDNPFFMSDVLIVNIPSSDITGYQSLVEKIKHSTIQQVILISSTSVYTNSNSTVSESSHIDTSNARYKIEQLFEQQASFTTLTLRFAGLIGPNRHPARFFKPGRVVSDSQAPVNMLHLDDCIEIIVTALDKPFWQGTLNCCADSHPTKQQFYTHACAQLGVTPPEFTQQVEISFKVISNERLKQQLDYRLIHPDLMKIEF